MGSTVLMRNGSMMVRGMGVLVLSSHGSAADVSDLDHGRAGFRVTVCAPRIAACFRPLGLSATQTLLLPTSAQRRRTGATCIARTGVSALHNQTLTESLRSAGT